MTERELKRFEEVDLGFCGCGDPVGALELLRDVLQAMNDRSSAARSGLSFPCWPVLFRKLISAP